MDPQPEGAGRRQLTFVATGIYPWLVVVAMIVAFLVTGFLDAGGSTTSLAIGIFGWAAIIFRTAYGWWLFIRLKPEERFFRQETRVWTGLKSTAVRWLSIVVELIGLLSMIGLTVLATSN